MSFALVALIVLADQASKFLVQSALALGESRPVVDGFLHFTHHANTGAAFGFFKQNTLFLTAVSVCFIAFMSVYLLRGGKSHRAAFLLILAGAIGNAVDRIRFGYVIDFIDIRVWPIFNVADSAITAGFILVLLAVVRGWARP